MKCLHEIWKLFRRLLIIFLKISKFLHNFFKILLQFSQVLLKILVKMPFVSWKLIQNLKYFLQFSKISSLFLQNSQNTINIFCLMITLKFLYILHNVHWIFPKILIIFRNFQIPVKILIFFFIYSSLFVNSKFYTLLKILLTKIFYNFSKFIFNFFKTFLYVSSKFTWNFLRIFSNFS